jgi:hypothetical protein
VPVTLTWRAALSGVKVADAGVGGSARKKKIQDDEWAYQKLIEQYAGVFYFYFCYFSLDVDA